MQNNQLCYLTIIEAAAALRKNDVSPVDLTEATLKRIQAIDSNLHAFITVTADLALQQARQAEQELSAGKDRGPLHGIPIALKDLYMTKGIRTTCHSAVLENWVPDYDATAVLKLEEAGTCSANSACTNSPSAARRSTRLFRRCAIRGILHTFPVVRAAAPARRSPRDL